MRTYVIDQLDDADIEAITRHLTKRDLSGGLEGIYWLPVADAMLTPLQKRHFAQCGPYALALEVEENAVRMELLVRARGKISCECLSFVSPALREQMIAELEGMLKELNIVF